MKRKDVRRLKLIAAVVVIGVCFVIVYSAMSGFASPYKYVSDVVDEPDKFTNKRVQIAAIIVDGTFEMVSTGSEMPEYEFEITDGVKNVPVKYRGNLPATFDQTYGVVVVGAIDSDGVFMASQLLTKCPSKYEEQIKENMAEGDVSK